MSHKPVEQLSKNRARFESIHSGTLGLSTIYRRLLTPDTSLTDGEVVEAYLKFSTSTQTNTYAAAELEWVTVAALCYFRPQLMPILIRTGLLTVVYSMGDDIDAHVVVDFIQQRILADGAEPYGGLPHEVGIHWLVEILPTQIALVQRILEDVIEQNKRA